MLRPTLVLAAFAALPLAAAPARAQTATPAAAAAPSPRIFLRTPTDGAVVRGGKVTIVFGLQNYGVAPAGMDFPNTGHFHLLIDADAPDPGVVIPTDAQHLHFGKGQIETSVELPPGRHVLRVVLGDHQHRVISKDLVSAPVRITVRR
jgi:hypothetical protein